MSMSVCHIFWLKEKIHEIEIETIKKKSRRSD